MRSWRLILFCDTRRLCDSADGVPTTPYAAVGHRGLYKKKFLAVFQRQRSGLFSRWGFCIHDAHGGSRCHGHVALIYARYYDRLWGCQRSNWHRQDGISPPGGASCVDDFVPTHGCTPENRGEQPFHGFGYCWLESMQARMYPEEGESFSYCFSTL